MLKPTLAVLGILAAPATLYVALGGGDNSVSSSGEASFVIPDFSAQAYDGKEYFASACGRCHGVYGEGTDHGPTLVHVIYDTRNFSDEQIREAVRHGAMARNWPFGDMPPVKGLTTGQLDMAIWFLREVQAANKID